MSKPNQSMNVLAYENTLAAAKQVTGFPYQVTLDSKQQGLGTYQHYAQHIKEMLAEILPAGLLDKDYEAEFLEHFHALLPLVTWSRFETAPFNLSFYLVCRHRSSVFKFFYEMLSRWLVPGELLNAILLFAADFRLEELSQDSYTCCHLLLQVESEEQFTALRRNLPIIEAELRLGATSSYHANRILEVKGLATDVKTAMLQEHIVSVLQRRPQDFGDDIFEEMQQFLVMCREEFKVAREYRHMSRIIIVLYLFKRALAELHRTTPEKRHISIKFLRARLHAEREVKEVLGVLVGVTFLKDNEVFEERHLMQGVSAYFPDARVVPGSYFSNRNATGTVGVVYLELERPGKEAFSLEEVSLLKKELPTSLKDRVEHLMHPVFMPRNEEEIMHNIRTLSQELVFVRDKPQVIISFDEQADLKLVFTVIMLHVSKPDTPNIEELFSFYTSDVGFTLEQTRTMGYVRNRYPKEANVFRLHIDKKRFLRPDHSLDLYEARQYVVGVLMEVFGDIRDYNGGMLAKQSEQFSALCEEVMAKTQASRFLLENFFYSLNPPVLRNVLELEQLKALYQLLDHQLQDKEKHEVSCRHEFRSSDSALYVVVAADKREIIDQITAAVEKLDISFIDLASVCINIYDTPCIGYVLRSDDTALRERFRETIESRLEAYDTSL